MSIKIKKSHRGLLHKNLGVPEGEKIPASKLKIKSSDSPAVKKRKQFAINAKKWKKGQDGLALPMEQNEPITPLQKLQREIAERQARGELPMGQGPLPNVELDILSNSRDKGIFPDKSWTDFTNKQFGNPKNKRNSNINWGNVALGAMTAFDMLLPQEEIKPPVVQPSKSYNPHPYGTGSQAIAEQGLTISSTGYRKNSKDRNKPMLRIPSNQITMEDVLHPVLGQSNTGDTKLMFPNQNYQFDGEYVDEIPLAKKGKKMKKPGKYISTSYQDGGPVPKYHFSPLTPFPTKNDSTYYKMLFEGLINQDPTQINDYNKLQKYGVPVPGSVNQGGISDEAYEMMLNKQNAYNDAIEQGALRMPIARTIASLAKKPKSTVAYRVAAASYEDGGQLKGGGKLSPEKAKEMLRDGTANGKKLTAKQKRYFGWIAGGSKAEDGALIPLTENGGVFSGPSHENNGIDMVINNQRVEVEGQEGLNFDPDGTAVIFSKRNKNPLTGNTYANDYKKIAKKQMKIDKLLDYSTELVNTANPFDKWASLKFNAGRAMAMGAHKKKMELESSLTHLGDLQEADNQLKEERGEQKKEAKYGLKIKAQAGTSVPPNKYEEMLKAAAIKNGVDYDIMRRLVFQESGFNPNAKSSRGAVGVMQFMPETAKKYGISKAQLSSTKEEDVQAVMDAATQHFKDLLTANNNDPKLALVAYNAGQGAVDFVKKKTKDSNLTGDEWIEYMSNKKAKSPSKNLHAWQNETLDYVTSITGTSEEDFFGPNGKGTKFRNLYYDKIREEGMKPYTVPPVTGPTIPNQPQRPNQPGINTNYQYNWNIENPTDIPVPTDAEPLQFKQILPELYAAATNQEEPVWLQQYNPELFQDYEVSLQDRRNRITSQGRASRQYLGDNANAQAILAAQEYDAIGNIDAEEFRINQGISADITNKNKALLNDAQLKNLQLADQQYVRQATGRSKTKATNQTILNSISNKILQNQLENRTLQVYENLYPHYRYDENYKLQKEGNPGSDYLQPLPTPQTNSTSYTNSTKTVKDAQGNIKSVTTLSPSELTVLNQQTMLETKKKRNLQNMFNSKKFSPWQ